MKCNMRVLNPGIVIIIYTMLILCGCTPEVSQQVQPEPASQDISSSQGTNKPAAQQVDVAKESPTVQIPGKKEENTPEPIKFRLEGSTFESIDKFLKSKENISYSWSNNKQYAAFSVEYASLPKDSKPDLVKFIWKVGENEPAAVKGVDDWTTFSSYYWSPDDSYFIHDTGTSHTRVGDICWTKGFEKTSTISYVGKPVWSPDSKWVMLGNLKRIETASDTSLEGTVDIVIYNVETRERRIVMEGTREYYLLPLKWDKDGTLTVEKMSFVEWGKKETVTKNISTADSKAITHDDQKEVEQLVNEYFKALEAKNYHAASDMLTYEEKIRCTQATKFEYYWPYNSIKLLSLENYIPPDMLTGSAEKNAPSVCFRVKYDAKFNNSNTVRYEGVNVSIVNVIKENDHWRIKSLVPVSKVSESVKSAPEKFNYTVQNLGIPYGKFISPAINGKILYLCAHTSSVADSLYEKLISVNLDTRKEEVIFESQHKLSAVQGAKCNDKWLIWMDCSAVGGGEPRVYAKDLSSGKTELICRDYLVSPSLYKDYAAWIEAADNNSKLILYNMSTGMRKEIEEVNFAKFFNVGVYMDEGKLLWTDSRDGKGFYNFFDLNSEKITSIEAPSKYPGYAKFTGNRIFSMDFDDFADWGSNRLAVFDMESKSYEKISSTYITRFDIESNSIAVIDGENKLWLGFRADEMNSMNDLENASNLLSMNVLDAKYMFDGRLVVYGESGLKSSLAIIRKD